MGQEEIEKLAEQNTPDIGRGRIEMASTVYVENLRLKFIKGYQKAQEWISVDTPPKEQGFYLVCGGGLNVTEVYYQINDKVVGFDRYKKRITHWQPLPKAPK